MNALHLPSLETFETAHAIGIEAAAAWGVPLARVVVECERTNAAGALWVAHVRGPGVVWCEWGADRTEALTHLCDAVRERADAAPVPDLITDLGAPFAEVIELHPAPSLGSASRTSSSPTTPPTCSRRWSATSCNRQRGRRASSPSRSTRRRRRRSPRFERRGFDEARWVYRHTDRLHRGETVHPVDEYLARNRAIVITTTVLVACPKEEVGEELRSGTWATVRYARKLLCSVVIVRPSGRIERER